MTPLSFVVYTKSIVPLTVSPRDDICLHLQRRQSGLKSGGRGSGSTKFQFSRQVQTKFRFLQAIFLKISIFPGKFSKNFDFFRQIFEKFRFCQEILKKFDFPGKNCSFTATSGQIILFLFKVTTFEHTSCTLKIKKKFPHPAPRPAAPPAQKLGVRDPPTLRIEAPVHL